MNQLGPIAAAGRRKPAAERRLESALFASRWLMAPFYVGLIASIGFLLWAFVREIVAAVPTLDGMGAEEAILVVLTLIDLSLAANLLMIVVFSGYENFVSKIDTADHEDRPAWMGHVDFSGLKMKLVASIVAISAISVLKAFMNLANGSGSVDLTELGWLVGIHLTFVVSGVLLALMDWLACRAAKAAADRH
jgi:uncharacterized protein (TIGR00645 family)